MTSTEVVEFSILIKSLVSRLFTYYSVVTERCNRTLSKEDFYEVVEFSVLIDSLKTELCTYYSVAQSIYYTLYT